MALEDIRNFLAVGERLGTAGQPSEEQLREVAGSGYTTVINLGLLDPRYCLPDEAGTAESLGLRYRHIPVAFDAPRVEDFRDFVRAMDEAAGEKIFVHCAANYRVSSFVALYAERRMGWSREKADAHARVLWPLNEVWTQFLEDCRRDAGDGEGPGRETVAK